MARGDTKNLGDVFHEVIPSSVQLSNLPDLFWTDFALSVVLSLVVGSVADAVLMVPLMSIPAEIVQSVVFWVSVVVTPFHVLWPWTDKGFQNETVNCSHFLVAGLFIEANSHASVFSVVFFVACS